MLYSLRIIIPVLVRLILRNEIDKNAMMAADDAFEHHDRVAVRECPVRLLAMPCCADSVLKFDCVHFRRPSMLLREHRLLSLERCFVLLPNNANLANLAGVKLDRDVRHSWFQFLFWELEFSVLTRAKISEGSAHE